MNVCSSFTCCSLYYPTFFVDVLLDKKKEILDMMIMHGILEELCEIFSTSTDEDTLV